MSKEEVTELLPLVIADIYEAAGALRRRGVRIATVAEQTQARWQLLSVISEGDWTVPRIARRLGVTRQAVQRTADQLRADGLINFEANSDHERSPLARPPPPGARHSPPSQQPPATGANSPPQAWQNTTSKSHAPYFSDSAPQHATTRPTASASADRDRQPQSKAAHIPHVPKDRPSHSPSVRLPARPYGTGLRPARDAEVRVTLSRGAACEPH